MPMGFTRDQSSSGRTVTLEHVPIKALGGQARCLTCRNCNADSGRSIDQAAAMDAQDERELSATWSAAAGSTMRNNVREVRLYAQALRVLGYVGYLLLTYDFYNQFDCLLEWMEAEQQETEAGRQADEGVF